MKEAIKDFFRTACTVAFGVLSIVFLLVVVVLAARILIMLGKGIINTSLCLEFLIALTILAVSIGLTRVLVDAADGVYTFKRKEDTNKNEDPR
jgi:cobalamin biosynthesis protein CobD/CbiB